MSDHSHHDNHGSGHDAGHDAGHDDWFRHSADEAMPQQEHASHVNTTAIGLTLLSVVFGVLFTVVLLSMYFVNYANTRKSQMNEGTASALPYITYRDKSNDELSVLGWVDRAAGTVNVPLDSAMDAVIAEYAAPGMRADAEWQGPASGEKTTTNAALGTSPHAMTTGQGADTLPAGAHNDTQEHASSDG